MANITIACQVVIFVVVTKSKGQKSDTCNNNIEWLAMPIKHNLPDKTDTAGICQ